MSEAIMVGQPYVVGESNSLLFNIKKLLIFTRGANIGQNTRIAYSFLWFS